MPAEIISLDDNSVRLCDTWINKKFRYSVKISEPNSIIPYTSYRTNNKTKMESITKMHQGDGKCRIVIYINKEVNDHDGDEYCEVFTEGIGTAPKTF